MILCDVNVYLYSYFSQVAHHERCRNFLRSVIESGQNFAVSELILAAVVRIGSNPKLFKPTPSAKEMLSFVNIWRTHDASVPIAPAKRHWSIFQKLISDNGLRGADTTDAYLAALAIEHNCEWWTADKGFGRYRGLKYRNVLSDT